MSMHCSDCNAKALCIDSRPGSGMCVVRRRYNCPRCGSRWTTAEVMQDDMQQAQKRIKSAEELKQRFQELMSGFVS